MTLPEGSTRTVTLMNELVKRAAVGIAGEMQVLAFEAGGPSRVYEADLRSATRRMIQLHHKNRVAAEVSVKPTGWKRVGGVDIAVYGAKNSSAFDALLELKWGGKIEESLWDAWKLAALYKQGHAWNAYLVSGAPLSTWSDGKPLARLWTSGTHRSSELWAVAAKARWGPNVGPPTVPAGVRIHEIAAVPIQTDGKIPWELRVVRVATTSGKEFALHTAPALASSAAPDLEDLSPEVKAEEPSHTTPAGPTGFRPVEDQ